MTAPAKRLGRFQVFDDPCAYLPSSRRFIPLRKLRRLAEQERALRERLANRSGGTRVARVA